MKEDITLDSSACLSVNTEKNDVGTDLCELSVVTVGALNFP